jgi:mannose-1-phosphate guanylyltransferase/mannose-6-phosphate isomerase
MNFSVDTRPRPAQSQDAGNYNIHPVILAGGSGTRLWPLSRAVYPKQLLALTSQQTLLQETVERNRMEMGFNSPILVCNEEHRFLIEDQMREIGVQPQAIMLEPAARNTAPAIAAVALWLQQREPDAVMLVQPSDHSIGADGEFHRAIYAALPAAQDGSLLTFGIRPTRPETGYGYIKIGAPLPNSDRVRRVDRFVEKPDAETAARFVESGIFWWNSGIFLMSVRYFLEELGKLHPEMLAACREAVDQGVVDRGFFRLDATAFAKASALSVDRAVMELTDRAAVVPVDLSWSDLGSWQALRDAGTPDANGNVVIGDVILEDAKRSYLRCDDKLLTVLGVDNLIVVAMDDVVLVANADRANEVPNLVEKLRQSNRSERLQHRTVYRPWGYYRSVDAGERFQVKRLMVKPGAQLSLQKHYHRAEHWVVVQGTALVQCGDDTKLVRENESVYIPIGTTHRLENPGRVPLHLIEVQSGAYLGEDDIVRMADSYGRCLTGRSQREGGTQVEPGALGAACSDFPVAVLTGSARRLLSRCDI